MNSDRLQSRLRAGDLVRTATIGLRTRRLRAVLSGLAVAVGIAAVVSVLGITRSSESALLAEIDRIGTNLLTVTNGQDLSGQEVELPAQAGGMIGRAAGVTYVAATAELPSYGIFRTNKMPAYATNGLALRACGAGLLSTLSGTIRQGTYLSAPASRSAVAVLGYQAATALGIASLAQPVRIWISDPDGVTGHWLTVIGILDPLPLAPEIDSSVLVGFPLARQMFGYDGHPSRIYVRAVTSQTAQTAALLAPTAWPEHPEQVQVSRPSDALTARIAVRSSQTALFLGLGAIAILAGGLGIYRRLPTLCGHRGRGRRPELSLAATGGPGTGGGCMRAREDANASPRRVFGAMLRHYRTTAGLSQEQLGARVYMSSDMIGKVEQGVRTPSEQLVGACEAIPQLGANGALRELRDQLKEHLKQRPYPGWFDRWPETEANAQTLRWFEPLVVPGLLQTEEYARAVLRTRVGDTEDEIEEMVAARLARQAILDREQPPTLWVIIDEGVLRRPVGGPPVMAGQLRKLAEMACRPDIVLQAIPVSAGAHQGLNGGAFIVADFAASPSVAYQDTALSGQIVDSADDIEALMLAWDTLRSEALPRTATLERIEDVLKTWT